MYYTYLYLHYYSQIFPMAASISFSNPKHSSHVFAMFAEMRDLEELCDIKIETNVDEISAHKLVLSACSPYFREALKDIDADEELFMVPEEYNSKVVVAIVNYFYTGRLEIEASLLPDILSCAVFFQVVFFVLHFYFQVDGCLMKTVQDIPQIVNCLNDA